jgi:hypothetical protein
LLQSWKLTRRNVDSLGGLILHVRFRIRTIMIVIATLAGVMGLLLNVGDVVTPTVVFFVVFVVEFSVYSFHLSRRRRDHGNSR